MSNPPFFSFLPLDARSAALRALKLSDDGLLAQHALNLALSSAQPGLSPRDRRLASELFYGVLRTEIRIDFLLGRVLHNSQKLPQILRSILRLGVYGLLFQDKVPQYAAVFAAVEQARRLFPSSLARLTNAVLRGIQRMGEAVFLPQFYVADETSADDAQWRGLCLYYSLPHAVADIWEKSYGRSTAIALLQRSFARPWTGLRLNATHFSVGVLRAALLAAGASAVAQNAFAFAPGTLPLSLLGKPLSHWHTNGAISFQSAGSQAVLEALGLAERNSCAWWDACAGQGGKALALLERGVEVVLCSDISLNRLSRISGQCRILGLRKPHIVQANAVAPPLARWGGHILLDVPCSGLGVLARRPDLRRRGNVGHLDRYVALQSRILRRTAGCLLPGRCLAYITCTLNPAENQGQIARFLAEHADFSLSVEWQTTPEHPWMEGMYGALLARGREKA
ncbi:MAG: antitermination protein NusB [Desulfovibrio sp.]|jgi:16S rRNA (cytosine967-C5)-methyltransferase|nr:antitermination protein NusB [Desulfovibrio sp.]